MIIKEIIQEQVGKNPIIDMTPYFPNYEELHAEVLNINPNNGIADLRIVSDRLNPGAAPSEKIEKGKIRGSFPIKFHFIKRAKIIR